MRQGFTLIELMIVIAIIAIIAAIAIPNLLESRVTANENAAASGLKSAIFAGETQFVSGSYNDADGDNRGEYGHLAQLSGWYDCYGGRKKSAAAPFPMVVSGTPLIGNHSVGSLTLVGHEFDASTATYLTLGLNDGSAPAFVAGADTPRLTWQGTINSSSGYFFGSLLATDGSNEPVSGAAPADAANPATLLPLTTQQSVIDRGEKYFVVGAFPETFGDTGRRAFFITQEGKVLSNAADITPYQAGTQTVTGGDIGSCFQGAPGVTPAIYYLGMCFLGSQAAPGTLDISAVHATCVGNRTNPPAGALVWSAFNK